MQQILIDNARRKQRVKHGANQVGEELHESRIAVAVPSEELLAVNDALTAFALEDPQAAEVVRLRYFVGMTVPEIATALDLAPRTVDRHAIMTFFAGAPFFTQNWVGLSPSFRTEVDIHGDTAEVYIECIFLNESKAIVAERSLSGTIRKINGNWRFWRMFNNPAQPLF